MIRKTVNSVLLFVFLVSSIGYSVSMHYCGTTRMSASIGMQAQSCCGDESGTCCHNEAKDYKINDSYLPSFRNINEQYAENFDLIVSDFDFLNSDHNSFLATGISFIPESPPPISVNTYLSTLQTYLL